MLQQLSSSLILKLIHSMKVFPSLHPFHRVLLKKESLELTGSTSRSLSKLFTLSTQTIAISISRLWWEPFCSYSTPFQSRPPQSSWATVYHESTAPFNPSTLSSSQRSQKMQFKLSTSHFLTSSQIQIDAKTHGFLWSLKSIMQKFYFHAST